MVLAGDQEAPPLVLTSSVPYISENLPIARSAQRVPHFTVPSVLNHFHTSPGRVQVDDDLSTYPVAVRHESMSVSEVVPSTPKSENIYPSVPGVWGFAGNSVVSGQSIELAQTQPTRMISARGMSESLRDIELEGNVNYRENLLY